MESSSQVYVVCTLSACERGKKTEKCHETMPTKDILFPHMHKAVVRETKEIQYNPALTKPGRIQIIVQIKIKRSSTYGNDERSALYRAPIPRTGSFIRDCSSSRAEHSI